METAHADLEPKIAVYRVAVSLQQEDNKMRNRVNEYISIQPKFKRTEQNN